MAAACGREHRCARRRLWGHRNEPALRVARGGQGCERAWRATRRFCSRRRFAHHLVADSHHLAEIRHPDPARRQSRGRRHRGAARNSQSETCAPANLARCDTRCGTRRRGIALWRWRNHARDFSAQRRRRPQGGCPRIGPSRGSRHAAHPDRLVRRPTQRNRLHRRDLRPDHAVLVHCHRNPRAARDHARARDPGRFQSRLRR